MRLNDVFETRTMSVSLAPEMLTAVVRSGKQVVACSEIRIDGDPRDGGWDGALAAFGAYLGRSGATLRAVPIAVNLSTRWCQLAMLPWSDALLYMDSARHYQQDHFANEYGDAALAWQVVCDDAPRGQARLACAIERELVDALHNVAHGYGRTCTGIESALTALARGIPPAPQDAFAVIEPHRVVLAARRHGRITGIRAQACSGPWHSGLPAGWEHWMPRTPELGEIAQVALFAVDGKVADSQAMGLVTAAGSWHTGANPYHCARRFHDQPEENRDPGVACFDAERPGGTRAGAAASGR